MTKNLTDIVVYKRNLRQQLKINFLKNTLNSKNSGPEFCYLRQYLGIGTVSGCLLQRMVTMDMDWNLKKRDQSIMNFFKFSCYAFEIIQKIISSQVLLA